MKRRRFLITPTCVLFMCLMSECFKGKGGGGSQAPFKWTYGAFPPPHRFKTPLDPVVLKFSPWVGSSIAGRWINPWMDFSPSAVSSCDCFHPWTWLKASVCVFAVEQMKFSFFLWLCSTISIILLYFYHKVLYLPGILYILRWIVCSFAHKDFQIWTDLKKRGKPQTAVLICYFFYLTLF